MPTYAFRMKLKPGFADEYRKRHDAIWPELTDLLKQTGISEYRIFFDAETHTLFAIQQVTGEQSSQALGENPLVQRWWAFMADIMETNPDQSPVSVPLNEVFYLQ